jgi:hypothetical protein
MPSTAKDDYYERVAAASGKNKSDADILGQKMTSDNYQEVYRQQQMALQKVAQKLASATTEELEKQATAAKKEFDAKAREKHLSSQIEAWKRTLGQDPETDNRTRATIETLSRELAHLRKK